jgi:ABC-type dipeptide/oligopeptide/nickel transport system ATPase component
MAPVLEVTDLRVLFPSEAGAVAAIRGLSYHVDAGEVLAVVGESGLGKSVSALSCCASRGWVLSMSTGTLISSPAASGSGSASPGRSSWSRR